MAFALTMSARPGKKTRILFPMGLWGLEECRIKVVFAALEARSERVEDGK